MKFIRLTGKYQERVYLNVDLITAVVEGSTGTTVFSADGTSGVDVKETAEAIVDKCNLQNDLK